MATLTHEGFWPLTQPTSKTKHNKTGKTLMERFIENQERRARQQISHILGSYDTDYLRRLGMSEAQIRGLVGSRFAATR
ncbi:MAG: hypothetical protein ACR2O4_13640 [Hyphomicrobiaceae bacterium]